MSDTPAPDAPEDGADDLKQGVAARQAAATIVLQVDAESAWTSPVTDRVLRASQLSDQDAAFAANLAFQTVRWVGTLDWILEQAVSRDLDAVEHSLLQVLRIGTWELLHGGQPDHAVLDSHVEVARSLVGDRATGFVNGVLRRVTRMLPDLRWPDPATADGLGLRHGYPEWIAQAALDRFSADRAPALLDAGNIPAPLVLRAIAPRDEVLAALADEGVEAEPGDLAPEAVIIRQRVVPGRLSVLRDHRATVQDQASQVVGDVAAAGLPAGATAIDLCAAPGGKATHLAQRGLSVTAVDRHAGRIRKTAELADRLGTPLQTVVADGRSVDLPDGAADLVLVDAPCSGLGVVRRRPELRWRRGPDDVTALAELQEQLLRRAVALTRPGGRVVYSVCTWTEDEADDVVSRVVADGDVELQDPPAVGTRTATGSQMAPDEGETDGMFVAVMQRT